MAKPKRKKRKAPKLGNGVVIPPPPGGYPGPPRSRKRSHSTTTCKGKRRFRDQREAESALHSIANRTGGEGRIPRRTYECPNCHGWHLTAQEVDGGGNPVRMSHAVGEDSGYVSSEARIRSMVERLRAEGLDQRADALEAMLPPDPAA